MNRLALFFTITFSCWLLFGCNTIRHTPTLKHEPQLDDGNPIKSEGPEPSPHDRGMVELRDFSGVAQVTINPSSFKTEAERDVEVEAVLAQLKMKITLAVIKRHPDYTNIIVTMEYLATTSKPEAPMLSTRHYQLRVYARVPFDRNTRFQMT